MRLSAIKRLEEKARELSGVVSLAQGIPSLASNDLIRKSVIESIENGVVDKYSPVKGESKLRQTISAQLQELNMNYGSDEVLVTAGSIEGLSATLLSLLSPGDEVIVMTPTYFRNYKQIIEMSRGKVVTVKLDESSGWSLPISNLKRKITDKTKAIIVCNPNNPTGSILTKEELLLISELAIKHNFVVICDDVYRNLVYSDEQVFNITTDTRYKKNVIRIVSLSKDFSLSGWRIGYLHGSQELIDKISVVHDNLVNCAPVVSQYAALAALENQTMILPTMQALYLRNRTIMGSYLEKMSDYLEFVWPEGSYYFFVRVKGVPDTEQFCTDLLYKAKVALVPGDDFGPGGEGHVRLCFGRSEEDIHTAMRRLNKYLDQRYTRHQSHSSL